MDRDTLRAALGRLEGVKVTGDDFEVAEGHRLTVYLGRDGQAMHVEDVEAGRLEGALLEVRQRPPKRATVVVEWDSVVGLRIGPSDERADRRTGFA